MRRKTHPSWTKEKVIQEANKYTTKAEWNRASTGSYQAAQRNEWMDEAAVHMISGRKLALKLLHLERPSVPNSWIYSRVTSELQK